MRRIGILTAGGDTPALNAAIHGAVARANQLRIEVYGLIKGFNCLLQPARAARAPESALSGHPRARSDQGRLAHRRVARLRRSRRRAAARSDRRSPEEARHRGARRHRRRRHAERPAAAGRASAHGAGAEDDRQRSRAELPERTRRMGAGRMRPTAARPSTNVSPRTSSSTSIRSSTTPPPATRRRCW